MTTVSAALDGENVFNRHHEGFVYVAGRRGNPLIDSVHQLDDRLVFRRAGVAAGAFLRGQRRTLDDGRIRIEVVALQQLGEFHLNQLDQLFVIHLIGLVEVDDHGRHFHLLGQQDVLASLRHGAVGRADDQDGAVHLRRAGDHILDVVAVARAVYVRVVAIVGFVFDVADIDGDAASAFFRRIVDIAVFAFLRLPSQRQNLGNGSGQGGLAVVDVTDRSDIYMGFATLEFPFRHLTILLVNLAI